MVCHVPNGLTCPTPGMVVGLGEEGREGERKGGR